MNFPTFTHCAMFVSAVNVGKTEYLLRILETEYKNHFEFIVIMCPTILDNKKTQRALASVQMMAVYLFTHNEF